MLLLGFTVTAFGLVVAARVKQMQAMMGLMQMILMPLMFLSGILYPLVGFPAGSTSSCTSTRSPTRCTRCARRCSSTSTRARSRSANLNPPLTWWGWPVPTLVQLSVVAVTGLFFLWVAVLEFDRAD